MATKYKAPIGLQSKQIAFSHVLAIVSGVPQQFPAIRILPGMEAVCFVGHLAAAADHIYIAKHNRPRVAANSPGAGAVMLSGNSGPGGNPGPFNLDGDVLSQWFADADGADFLTIVVYMNRSEQFA